LSTRRFTSTIQCGPRVVARDDRRAAGGSLETSPKDAVELLKQYRRKRLGPGKNNKQGGFPMLNIGVKSVMFFRTGGYHG
jgi:hypothetical protein